MVMWQEVSTIISVVSSQTSTVTKWMLWRWMADIFGNCTSKRVWSFVWRTANTINRINLN